MDGTLAFAVLAGAVFIAFATEAFAGFGSLLIALALGAQVYPIDELLPVLVPLSCTVTGFIVVRHGAHVDRALLFGRIVPFMGAGAAAGYAVARAVDGPALKAAFGALVLLFAGRELKRARRSAPPAKALRPAPWLVAAGVVHGVYACGGPLLVYAVGRSGLDKRRFRSTLAAVWLTLNLLLTAAFGISGRLTPAVLSKLGLLAPLAALAIVAGEWGHRRIDERRFRIVVLSLLLVAGASLAASAGSR